MEFQYLDFFFNFVFIFWLLYLVLRCSYHKFLKPNYCILNLLLNSPQPLFSSPIYFHYSERNLLLDSHRYQCISISTYIGFFVKEKLHGVNLPTLFLSSVVFFCALDLVRSNHSLLKIMSLFFYIIKSLVLTI